MKTIKVVFALFITILSFSCQKEIASESSASGSSSGANSGSALFRPKTYTEDVTSSSLGNSVTTYNLTYDASGRLLSMVSASSPGDKFVYQYSSNNTYTMDIYNSNKVSIHSVFFINSFSLIDSIFKYNDTKDTSTSKYLYNSSKQLVKQKEYDYTTARGAVLYKTYNYEYDSNGNVIKESDNSSVKTYDYYSNLSNNLSIGLIYFLPNKNLPKTTTYTSGGQTETLNHTYTFDNNNRLSTEKIVASSGDVIIRTYTY